MDVSCTLDVAAVGDVRIICVAVSLVSVVFQCLTFVGYANRSVQQVNVSQAAFVCHISCYCPPWLEERRTSTTNTANIIRLIPGSVVCQVFKIAAFKSGTYIRYLVSIC